MDINDLSALLGEDLSDEGGADIWVAALGAGGHRLVAEARRLADGLGCYVHAAAPPDADAAGLIAAGADRVHLTADPTRYLASQRPEFVLFEAKAQAAAVQYAQGAGAGLISMAAHVNIEEGTRALLAEHGVYGGEYAHALAVTSPVKVATIVANTLQEPYLEAGRSGEVLSDETSIAEEPWRDAGPADYTPPTWRPLSKARIVVAAGRGVRDEAGFALVQQVAAALGAELAGDRSAVSSGWIDEAHEVGVTGQEIAPEVYVALGILGDTMHNAAIAGARRVIAVHANPEAPIFAAADVAIIAEPKEWVPQLLAALATG